MNAIGRFVEQGSVGPSMKAKHDNSKRGDCAANELCDIGIWQSQSVASIAVKFFDLPTHSFAFERLA